MPFITFEGIEGSGKSTQARRAAEYFRGRVGELLLEREPGGTRIGAAIRAILLDPANRDLDPVAELLLMEADRRQHVVTVIAPAISRGALVLCDRFNDATFAYQGAGRRIDPAMISRADAWSVEGTRPDRTLVFDCPVEVGLARVGSRDAERRDRFEAEGPDFHSRVRQAYREIARREPGRVSLIDAARTEDEIFPDVVARISEVLG